MRRCPSCGMDRPDSAFFCWCCDRCEKLLIDVAVEQGWLG